MNKHLSKNASHLQPEVREGAVTVFHLHLCSVMSVIENEWEAV